MAMPFLQSFNCCFFHGHQFDSIECSNGQENWDPLISILLFRKTRRYAKRSLLPSIVRLCSLVNAFLVSLTIESELYGVVVSSVVQNRELTYVSRGSLIFWSLLGKFLSPSDFTFTQWRPNSSLRHQSCDDLKILFFRNIFRSTIWLFHAFQLSFVKANTHILA